MSNWMVKGEVLSDYLQACKEANLSNFKRDIRLNRIFEHSTIEQGLAYLDFILKTKPSLLDNIFTNDMQGNPIICDWGNGIYYSPSTLQYIAVLSNLITKFGILDGMRIVEVGGGYGGQAKTVLDAFKPKVYKIVDLPEVVDLQLRYLQGTGVRGMSVIPTGNYELFISNYALSEIPNNADYIKLASRCKHGYITCNTNFVTLPWEHIKEPDITNESNNYILSW